VILRELVRGTPIEAMFRRAANRAVLARAALRSEARRSEPTNDGDRRLDVAMLSAEVTIREHDADHLRVSWFADGRADMIRLPLSAKPENLADALAERFRCSPAYALAWALQKHRELRELRRTRRRAASRRRLAEVAP
jgi:hypothetical protein